MHFLQIISNTATLVLGQHKFAQHVNSPHSPLLASLFILYACFFPNHADALEIPNYITKDCVSHAGLILNVDEATVKLLAFNGEVQTLGITDIDTIYLFNENINPFTEFNLANESSQFLKEVYYSLDQKQPSFVGWPVKYVENLVFFYSTEAKLHVIDPKDIAKLRPAKNYQPSKLAETQSVQFEFPESASRCKRNTEAGVDSGQLLRPIRILNDRIKIDQFHDSYIRGLQKLNNFQDRTYLYARPYLFPKRKRLALSVIPEGYGINPNGLSYTWPSGSEYHFQSLTGIGSQISENQPYLQTQFMFRSDFKTHFFNGTFEGNLEGTSAGTFTDNSFEDHDPDNNKGYVTASFNYLALMGADYGPYSVAFGPYFPEFLVFFDRYNRRSVMAYTRSPMIRFTYTKPDYKIRFSASQTQYKLNKNDIFEQIGYPHGLGGNYDFYADTFRPDFAQISDYRFKSRFFRVGGDMDVNQRLSLFADVYVLSGNYSEVLAGVNNTINFSSTGYRIGIANQFGHYINLRMQYQILNRRGSVTYNNNSHDDSETISSLGGQIEFLF